ncbi:DAACS family dicarboxylate/amino acid:cation (Na+ or H+) symporter [Anseongella ginsenosidimutans]|uniref:DAACS family dicarboxylate/amino acid:cation (Na+ or H+) symporter n=1 Tax=Anseongella ginsenosidimutans TaxID=496056 RepID=A0A4R3KT04_9SPHI|nr:dicarboxylate/amino acid:cation symporter [Anseongella ginsenosidimutans]QEC53111.1 dicarboxylate/amino acid:cation symporter [Anseongella ginsenosidimutans]TCS87729.1 DAACS family dicarboxylate/amino acid:cation (Na+ or H+) symporter [Anseongella ginsenosidimutans]
MPKLKKPALHTRILLGMIIGILAGVIVKQTISDQETIDTIVKWVEPIGQIFLRLIFMTVIPLILSALVLGIAEIGDLKRVGRIGLRLLAYSLIVSSISVFIGIAMVNLFEPGNSLTPETRDYLTQEFLDDSQTAAKNAAYAQERTVGDVLTNIVPKNPLEDMTRAFDSTYMGGGLLAVMFFALIFGIAMASVDPVKTAPVKAFFEGLYEIVIKIIGYAMRLAPYGVAALLFNLTVNVGASFLLVLLKYVLIVLAALAIHQFVTYSVILKFFAGRSPLKFFNKTGEVMITAFSTSSSNATLPTAIAVSIEKLKIPKPIANFVLTIGSTANQNGTALFEGITVLFLAQCFNVDLSLTSQITVVFLCILAGIGTAGVPGGSLPVIVTILVSIGVPGEAIGLIYGVDRILDMSRTVLNVTGDITAAAYIQKVEEKAGQGSLELPG